MPPSGYSIYTSRPSSTRGYLGVTEISEGGVSTDQKRQSRPHKRRLKTSCRQVSCQSPTSSRALAPNRFVLQHDTARAPSRRRSPSSVVQERFEPVGHDFTARRRLPALPSISQPRAR